MTVLLALVLTLGCALLLYLCSTQQRLLSKPWPRQGRALAVLPGAGGLAAWIDAAGTGAGVAAALTTLMLGCVLLPYAAWWRSARDGDKSP